MAKHHRHCRPCPYCGEPCHGKPGRPRTRCEHSRHLTRVHQQGCWEPPPGTEQDKLDRRIERYVERAAQKLPLFEEERSHESE